MTEARPIKNLLTSCVAATFFWLPLAHADDNVNLKLAYAQNSQPVKDALRLFGKLVEEKTDGSISVAYFPDSQLGGESELVELLQSGAIDITKVSGGLMGSFSPRYNIFSMPYLFASREHFYEVMNNNDIMSDLYQSTEDQGFIGIGWYDSGQRNFYTKDHPIETVSDLSGLKIRVMQNQTAVDMMKLLGASPVVMSQEEVYTSLQQGILDGAENNEFALTTARHGEVVQYYSLDGHTRVPDIVLMNSNTLAKLSDTQKEAIKEAMMESTQYEIKEWDKAIAEARNIIQKEFGVRINKVDKTPFRKAVQPMYEALENKPKQYATYQKIKKLEKD